MKENPEFKTKITSLTDNNLLKVWSITTKYASSNISSSSTCLPLLYELLELSCLLKLTRLLTHALSGRPTLEHVGETGADLETTLMDEELLHSRSVDKQASNLSFFKVRYISAMSPSSSISCSISSRTWYVDLLPYY